MNNGRWISKELNHLSDYMNNLQADLNAGNLESAKTNLGFIQGIVKGMVKRESQSLRGVDKMGASAKFVYKKFGPLILMLMKEASRGAGQEIGRKTRI
ncbi:hypothetical protein LCGC14_1755710 [marine sediment metagenome]|uniref:Uncharacterized protein n=1 Tax=marine sediment metagenome TaxID=412755 RepID=A0A0F9H2M4_9ZZZZ